MHYSQGGTILPSWGSEGPYEYMLTNTCLGCHSATPGSTWKDPITDAPIVFNAKEPTYGANGLAGGNFYYSRTDNKGHNVFSSNIDDTLVNSPPGGAGLKRQLTCSGTFGCHGHNGLQEEDSPVDNETEAIKGGHHGQDDPPLPGSLTDVSKNYRFLLGIRGMEATNWEQSNSNTSHNEYMGSTKNATNTISYLCAECHENFHTWKGGASEVGTASPWLRHPTDNVLKSTGEYSSYLTYSMVAPVARPDPDDVKDTTQVTPGTDIIMCLSCHRAHASPYYKMLRWDYKSSDLSSALSGCAQCHTSKD